MQTCRTPRSVWRHSVLRVSVCLESLGGDVDKLLQKFGLTLEQLFQPGYRVPSHVLNQMMDQCQLETGRKDFGVLAGQKTPVTNSALGVSVRASKTALDGINRFIKFAPVIESSAVFKLQCLGDTHIMNIGGWDERFNTSMLDAMVSSICLAVDYLTPDGIKPLHITMQQSQPENPATWHEFLAESIEWGASTTSIAWNSAALLHPRLLADERTALLNDALMEPQLQQVLRSSLTQRVEAQMAAHLEDGAPTPELIASDLAVGTRTLQRLLKEDGTTFKEILKLLRQRYAKEKMLNSSATVSDIASQLGYEDPGVFSKAFKTWFGLSPSEYIEKERHLPKQ